MPKMRIGTRESRLAVVQAQLLAAEIRRSCKGIEPELVTMKTTGDRILDRALDKIGGKGLFVKELDHALRENRSDVSVHSLKDVPMQVPEDLPLLGFSKREDARDVLVLQRGANSLDPLLPLGCSSARRALQLRELFPDMEVKCADPPSKAGSGRIWRPGFGGGGIEALGTVREDQPLLFGRGAITRSRPGNSRRSGKNGRRLFLPEEFF